MEDLKAQGAVTMATETGAKETRLRPDTVELLRKRAGVCFMCGRPLESMDPDGTLRPWPPGATLEEVEYPVEAQRYHILGELERASEAGRRS